MGVNDTHNTVGENISAYNTARVLTCQGGRRVLFSHVYRVRTPVLWFDLYALPYFLRPFSSPYRAGVPGRWVPVSSDCASRRRAVSRGSAHARLETWVGVGSSAFGQAFWSERPSGGGLESRASAPVGEAGWSWKWAPFLLC